MIPHTRTRSTGVTHLCNCHQSSLTNRPPYHISLHDLEGWFKGSREERSIFWVRRDERASYVMMDSWQICSKEFPVEPWSAVSRVGLCRFVPRDPCKGDLFEPGAPHRFSVCSPAA